MTLAGDSLYFTDTVLQELKLTSSSAGRARSEIISPTSPATAADIIMVIVPCIAVHAQSKRS
jgi:hypothetical protein